MGMTIALASSSRSAASPRAITSYGPVTPSACMMPLMPEISRVTWFALPTSVWIRMYALTTENPPRAGPAAIVLGTDSRRLLERADGLLHRRLSRGAPERPPRQRRARDRERQTPVERPSAKPSGDEPRGEGRPGPRRVDDVDGDRLGADDLIAPHREAAALSELHGDDRAVFGQRLGRDVHIVDAGDRADLDRVREQHVGLGQKVEQTAVPVPRRIPVRIDRRRRTRLMRLIEEFQQVRTERLLKVERRDMHVPAGRQHRTVDVALVQRGDRADVGHDRLGLVALHHDRQARGALGIDNDTGRVDAVRVERLDDEPSERVVADDAGERDVEAECRRAARRDSARTTERQYGPLDQALALFELREPLRGNDQVRLRVTQNQQVERSSHNESLIPATSAPPRADVSAPTGGRRRRSR